MNGPLAGIELLLIAFAPVNTTYSHTPPSHPPCLPAPSLSHDARPAFPLCLPCDNTIVHSTNSMVSQIWQSVNHIAVPKHEGVDYWDWQVFSHCSLHRA